MFGRKPLYTQDMINQQVTNLERLNKLLDMSLQKRMVTPVEHPDWKLWQDNVLRYSRDIESGQRYLKHMTDKVSGYKA